MPNPKRTLASPPRRSRVLRRMVVGVAAAALAGCGGIGLDSASSLSANGDGANHAAAPLPGAASDGGGRAAGDSALPTVASPGGGTSPLCNWGGKGKSVCFPDQSTSCNPMDAGKVPPPDATPDADAGAAPDSAADPDAGPPPMLGCHVTSTPGGPVEPMCSVSGNDGEGRSCFNGASCAAGSECVSATGECRRYCCDMSTCDGEHFCDIQPAHGSKSPIQVPVCMPITAACKLLGADCGLAETCAVVNEGTGATSCVAAGPRTAGEECETNHCALNLTCLGSPGSRKCHKLCRVDGYNSCGIGEECRGNSTTFKGQDRIGVCAKIAP